MENRFRDTKYKYKNGYLGLGLERFDIPDDAEVEGGSFRKKSEFHVSLLCVKNILEEYPDLEDETLDCFYDFVKLNDISFTKFTEVFRLATRDTEREKA